MIDNEIFNIFKEIGIPSHLLGYEYLKTAIKLVCENEELKNKITKKLYPEIAKVHNSTPSRVERAIRNAIERSFYQISPDVLYAIFGRTIKTKNEKPTNNHFICAIVEHIKMSRMV